MADRRSGPRFSKEALEIHFQTMYAQFILVSEELTPFWRFCQTFALYATHYGASDSKFSSYITV